MKINMSHIVFLFFITAVQAVFAAVPAIKKDCTVCHTGHGNVMGVLLKRPLPELCTECHPERTGTGEHPVSIQSSYPVPVGLPLGDSGQITCITCHAPHGEGDFPKMLRKNPTEICISCHKK